MLKNYWPAYQDCPECGKRQKNNKVYFECKDSDCGYIEKQYIRKSKRRQQVEPKIREIMEYLLTNDPEYNEPLPQFNFPNEAEITHNHFWGADSHVDCVNNAGWYEMPPIHKINIPQKALYLPNKEIVEVSAHETAHVPTWKDGHGEKWFQKTSEYRRKAFSRFASFAYQKNEETQYILGDLKQIYKNNYGYDLEDLTYDPYEDD